MMLLAPLLIVISVGGSYGRDYECFRRENNCDRNLIPDGPPENPEELLKTCRSFETFGACVADVTERCDPDDKEIEELRNAVDYISTTCQEDNPTFEAISGNFDCFMKVTKSLDLPCLRTLDENTMETMIEHIQPLIENERTEVLQCLEHIMNAGCITMKYAHNCGERVGEAVEDILTNIKPGSDVCTPEILEEIYPLLEVLGSIVSDEIATLDKLEKKRK